MLKDKNILLDQQDKRVREQLSKIKHKIIVMSGKGGVGKSTIKGLPQGVDQGILVYLAMIQERLKLAEVFWRLWV